MGELTWHPPGAGLWRLTLEHCPVPVSRLHAQLLPAVISGWARGAARFGLPMGERRFETVNTWFYFGGSPADPATFDALEPAARETLATHRWRAEVAHWLEVERPVVTAANLARQRVDPRDLDDPALAAHFTACVDHFLAVAPLHFEHSGFAVAAGLLFLAARDHGIDPAEVVPLLAGASPASSAAKTHIERIAAILREAGASAPASLDDVRAASADAAEALDAYLGEFGWRLIEGFDLSEPTLIEHPALIASSIRARFAPVPNASATDLPARLRDRIPAHARLQFDQLLADARASYQLRDDDVGVCFLWPLGLVRRAVLAAADRVVVRGALTEHDHLFEAEPSEIVQLLGGRGPSAEVLAGRAELRARAAVADPPAQLGEPLPRPASAPLPPSVATLTEAVDACWSVEAASSGPTAGALHGTGIGTGVARGRACVLDGPDAIAQLDVGDVIVATSTASSLNALFPIVAAVATEYGGLLSHAAILARELDLPAVVGVSGLLAHVHQGDLIEVDADAGAVRIIEPADH